MLTGYIVSNESGPNPAKTWVYTYDARPAAMTYASKCCLSAASDPLCNFTGKERDAESGNDYFGARYYASSMGRFTSPDDGSDFDPESPQNWNLYSYVRNNPLSSVDENGRQVTVCSFVNNADGSTGQACNTISDAAYAAGVAAQQAQNANNGPYSGIQAPGGARPDGIITDNGQAVGTATWSPDPPSSLASGQAIPGDMGLSFVAIGGATKLGGMALKAGLDFVFKAGAEAGGKSFAELWESATTESSTSRVSWKSSEGGFSQAQKDFDSLGGTSTKAGPVEFKELPNGEGRAILRGFSNDGRATIELQPAGGGAKGGMAIKYNP
jgi:RHS repeat-associated protein